MVTNYYLTSKNKELQDNNIHVLGIRMDGHSAEEIAREATVQIVELFDRLAEGEE